MNLPRPSSSGKLGAWTRGTTKTDDILALVWNIHKIPRLLWNLLYEIMNLWKWISINDYWNEMLYNKQQVSKYESYLKKWFLFFYFSIFESWVRHFTSASLRIQKHIFFIMKKNRIVNATEDLIVKNWSLDKFKIKIRKINVNTHCRNWRKVQAYRPRKPCYDNPISAVLLRVYFLDYCPYCCFPMKSKAVDV